MLKWISVLAVLVASVPAQAQAPKDDPLPEGPGKAIAQRMCAGCHKITIVTAKRATPEQWAAIVQQMVERGADGTDDEVKTLVHYLAVSFPPADKPAEPPPPSITSTSQRSDTPIWRRAPLELQP
jgi:mono/diheme cytochrome c family protein